MKFSLDLFKKQNPPDSALGEWLWLIGDGKKIEHILITGDVLLSDTEGKMYMLNASLATFEKVANSKQEFEEKVQDDTFFDEHIIAPNLAKFIDKVQKEKPLSDDQVYHFSVSPLDEGKYTRDILEKENIWPMSVTEHLLDTGEKGYRQKVFSDLNGRKVGSLDAYFIQIRREAMRLVSDFEKIWISARGDSEASEIRLFYKQGGTISEATDTGKLKGIFRDLWDVCSRDQKTRWVNATFILGADGTHSVEYDGYDSHSLVKMNGELYMDIWKATYMPKI